MRNNPLSCGCANLRLYIHLVDDKKVGILQYFLILGTFLPNSFAVLWSYTCLHIPVHVKSSYPYGIAPQLLPGLRFPWIQSLQEEGSEMNTSMTKTTREKKTFTNKNPLWKTWLSSSCFLRHWSNGDIKFPKEKQASGRWPKQKKLIPMCLWSCLPLQEWWGQKRRKKGNLQRKRIESKKQNGIEQT